MEDFMGNFILYTFILVMANLGSIAKSALLNIESWNEIIRTNIVLSIIITLWYWLAVYDIELHIFSFLLSCFVFGVMMIVLCIIKKKYEKHREGVNEDLFLVGGIFIFTIVKYIFKIKLVDIF
ncbi:hypothetical protein [Treponema denticola]|uniref:hypothetical protein n=1 Tax=Treponema denticola TaxID=158 RepID=UPI0001FD3826|nr:hypothetical protein [Treponema denticola]EGC77313.1 hypothetical protein HMPREF9353_01663 [Treponema denticola F0402]